MSDIYVPLADRDAKWYVFKELYTCSVPYLQSLDTEFIKEMGIRACGDSDIDKAMANQQVVKMLPITMMAMLHHRGVIVRIVNPADVERIYNSVQNYLETWANIMRTTMHKVKVPREDLLALEEFANAVYGKAKFIIHNKPEDISDFQRDVRDAAASTPGALFDMFKQANENEQNEKAIARGEKTIEEIEADKFPERNSLRDVLTRNTANVSLNRPDDPVWKRG